MLSSRPCTGKDDQVIDDQVKIDLNLLFSQVKLVISHSLPNVKPGGLDQRQIILVHILILYFSPRNCRHWSVLRD